MHTGSAVIQHDKKRKAHEKFEILLIIDEIRIQKNDPKKFIFSVCRGKRVGEGCENLHMKDDGDENI